MKQEMRHNAESFFNALPEEIKESLPVSILQVKEVGEGSVIVDKSEVHHANQFACFWFYKPISQMYKTFEK